MWAGDVALYTPEADILADPDRLCVSSGLVRAEDVPDRPHEYAANSFLPRPPWRAVVGDELTAAWAPVPPAEKHSGLALVRIANADVLTRWQSALVPAEARFFCGAASQEEMLGAVRSACNVCGEATFLGVAGHRPGLPTLTIDRHLDLAIGMHLDSFDKHPPDQRDRCRNRVCINVGDTDRFLLFVPWTVGSFKRRLTLAGRLTAPSLTVNSLVTEFLAAFPDEPVYRLRVRPGEAYIAPTENLIHDGSTVDSRGPTYAATFLGHFWFT